MRLLMLGLAWLGTYTIAAERLERKRWLLRAIFCSFPLGFIATLTGWFTPRLAGNHGAVYGQLRTDVATTPFLTSHQVATTLVIFGLVYALIFIFGAVYIYRLWRRAPVVRPEYMIGATNPKRPLSLPGSSPGVSSPSQTPVAEVVR